jgi:hypothetical protein
VPCERVFSSAKETDTSKRNNISPILMEALQLLKFSLKKERLNFIAGWSTSEKVMTKVPKPANDLLGALLVENSDDAVDKVLNSLSIYENDD